MWLVGSLFVGLSAVFLATGLFFARSIELEQVVSLAENDAIAQGVAASILAHEDGHLNVLLSYAGRFRFREAIQRRDRMEALAHLRQLHEAFPELDRPFLADPAGVVWAAYPEVSELYGKSFARRDWYVGVSREWRPYVSEVFQSARDQALSVALVAPVRDRDGQVIGIIGSAQRLETIRQWLLPLRVPGGDLYVVDQKGQFVFHRTRTGVDHLRDYVGPPLAERLLRGGEGVAELLNPVEGEVRLTAYRRLGWLGWRLVVYREKSAALHRIRMLMLISGGVGVLLTTALGALGVMALRGRRQMAETVVALQEKTRAVEEAQRELVEKERIAGEAREEAERANHAKSEFLSRMSHELRTPLNAILGFAQLLEMDGLNPEQRDSVAHILKGGRHLLGLIDEVLDISRIESGRLPLSPEPVLASEILLEALDLARPLAAQRSIEFRAVTTEAWNQHVLADRQRLKQVLLNFLSNAVKFNRVGGVVTVSCEHAAAERLRVKVTDTGPGIQAEMIERLFTPFERLGADQSGVEGTGLGLALSKRLVEVMGGAIGVDTAVGRGSIFWVELPRAEHPAELVFAGTAEVTPAPTSPTLGTVLYIEDNPSNLRLVQRVVALRPRVKLLSAMSGRLGLELAREHRPDLILLDLHLPDIPGTEVLEQLQADRRTRETPVVVISADATPGQIERLLGAGAREFLTKPVDVKRLIQLLDDTLKADGR